MTADTWGRQTLGRGTVALPEFDRTLTQALNGAVPMPGSVLEYAGESWDQDALRDEVARVAGGLRELGVAKGDRVTVYAPNMPEHIFVFMAVAQLGAINAFVNPQWQAEEARYLLRDAASKVVIVSLDTLTEGLRAVAETAVEHVVVVDRLGGVRGGGVAALPQGCLPFDVLSRAHRLRKDFASPSDPVALWYTSGTTGRPKGATWTHRSFLYNALSFLRLVGIGPGDTSLRGTSCAHCGVAPGGIGPILAGGKHLLHARVSPRAIIDSLGTGDVHHITAAPAVMRLVHREAMKEGFEGFRAVRALTMGGADISADLLADLGALFPEAALASVYAASEGFFSCHVPRSSAIRSDPNLAGLGSCGEALPGTSVTIVDDDWLPLPKGVIGRVAVQGPGVMSGYWKRSESTRTVLRDGVVAVGDLGRVDDGLFRCGGNRRRRGGVSGGEPGRDDDQERGDRQPPVVELHRRNVLEEIQVPGADLEPFAGKEFVQHQRKGVVDHPRIQSRHQRTAECRHEDHAAGQRRQPVQPHRHRIKHRG